MSLATLKPENNTKSFAKIIRDSLKPNVRRIDLDGFYPESFMREYGASGAYRPVSVHGQLGSAIENCSLAGQVCGSTAFSIWCHNTCLWYLSNTDNFYLRDRYLEKVANAEQLGATGLSNPVKSFFGIEKINLHGEKTSTGYRVKGFLPWVSNLLEGHIFGGIFKTDKRYVFALFDTSCPNVRLSPAGPFAALEGTATNAVRFLDADIPDEMILAPDAKSFLGKVKAGFILLQMGIGLGLMEGAINDMRLANKRLLHTNRYLPEGPDYFSDLLADLKQRTSDLSADPVASAQDNDLFLKVLQLRLDAAEITRKTTYSAFLHQGSSGYMTRGSGQRRVREGMFFDILSPSVKHLYQWIDTIK